MSNPAVCRLIVILSLLLSGIVSPALAAIPYIDQEILTNEAIARTQSQDWDSACQLYAKLETSTDRFDALNPKISQRMNAKAELDPGLMDATKEYIDKEQYGQACTSMYIMTMALVHIGKRLEALVILDQVKSAFANLGYPIQSSPAPLSAQVDQPSQAWRLPPGLPQPRATSSKPTQPPVDPANAAVAPERHIDAEAAGAATTCRNLANLYARTRKFFNLPREQLAAIAGKIDAQKASLEAQRLAQSGEHAASCVLGFQSAAGLLLDQKSLWASVSGDASMEQANLVIPTPNVSSPAEIARLPSFVGRYKCAAFQGHGILISSMPEMRIDSSTHYTALGGGGTIKILPDKRPDPDIFAKVLFSDGPLQGKYAWGTKSSSGSRALIFPKNQLDLSDTQCYGPQ